jgi:hypothetical protein
MIIKVRMSDETWNKLVSGNRRLEGTIGYDKWTGETDFNAFNRKSREPGYVAPPDAVLRETANGWLRKSKRRFKIFSSVKCSIGCRRSAEQLLSEARELTDYLKNTKSIEEIMDEV